MRPVLEYFLTSKPDLTLVDSRHGILSEKPPGMVVLVTDRTDNKKWVVRLSPMSEDHRGTSFIEEWESRDRSFLPRMKQPDFFELEGTDYATEEYEYVGQYKSSGEKPQLNDLFEFMISLHKATHYRTVPPILFQHLYHAICGLAELHIENWYHLDFSLENIVVHGDRTVLIDFEGSLHLSNDSSQFAEQDDLERTKREFVPPEVNKHRRDLVVPADVDVWSVGVTLFQVLTFYFPFSVDASRNGQPHHPPMREKWEYLALYGFEAFVRRYFRQDIVDKLHAYEGAMDLLSKIFIVYKAEETADGRTVYRQDDMGQRRISVRDVANHEFFHAVRTRWRAMCAEEKESKIVHLTTEMTDTSCHEQEEPSPKLAVRSDCSKKPLCESAMDDEQSGLMEEDRLDPADMTQNV